MQTLIRDSRITINVGSTNLPFPFFFILLVWIICIFCQVLVWIIYNCT